MTSSAPYKIDLPAAPACVVADSPHSGRDYPADFGYACPLDELRKAEDARLDELYSFLPQIGVAFLQASFPRAYIDPNRQDSVSARYAAAPGGVYTPSDAGLVRAHCTPRSAEKIYDRVLSLKEVFARVAGYWQPYHDRLEQLVDDAKARHGRAVHLDLHSMPSVFDRAGTQVNAYDVILGTRDGTSAPPALAAHLCRLFAAKGYRTGIDVNSFKGREIVRRTGNPADNRHAIQVEINRRLYLNEETLELSGGFGAVQKDLKEILTDFTVFCGSPALSPRRP